GEGQDLDERSAPTGAASWRSSALTPLFHQLLLAPRALADSRRHGTLVGAPRTLSNTINAAPTITASVMPAISANAATLTPPAIRSGTPRQQIGSSASPNGPSAFRTRLTPSPRSGNRRRRAPRCPRAARARARASSAPACPRSD